MSRIIRLGLLILFVVIWGATSSSADMLSPKAPVDDKEDWFSWDKSKVGLKMIKDEGGPLNLGGAFIWDQSCYHQGRRWKGSLASSGQVQTDSGANSTPIKAGGSLAAMHRLQCFPDNDILDESVSVTAPVVDLGLRAAVESNQRFSESLALVGLEARFENYMNAEGLMSALPDLTASIDQAQRFTSEERQNLGLSEDDNFVRWSIAALWRSNLGTWMPGDSLDRFFVNFGLWHTEELSPEQAWGNSGFDRSTGWKVELETQLADLIGDRKGGVLTAASVFVGYESGVIAPATTKNDTVYLYLMWDGKSVLRR
ncbi:MAG: hypothetical protein WCI03_10875 [bacterium]